MVSHTGVLGVHQHWRNIDDEQLRAVADRGGCVGVIFALPLPRRGIDRRRGRSPPAHHRRGRRRAAALGSDFDGFVVPPEGLEDVAALPT